MNNRNFNHFQELSQAVKHLEAWIRANDYRASQQGQTRSFTYLLNKIYRVNPLYANTVIKRMLTVKRINSNNYLLPEEIKEGFKYAFNIDFIAFEPYTDKKYLATLKEGEKIQQIEKDIIKEYRQYRL